MLAAFRDWLDHRTGYRKIVAVLLIEHIPGGAKWRYVWGSTLVFVFMIQVITGVLLTTAYSPGDSTAWASVYYIQYEMDFGWLIRGLHHFGSGTMVVLLGLHMLQVVIAGAHLPPREINWWLGLILLAMVLAMSLTGYLLPWDQKGYWATQVATTIMRNVPYVGPWMQKIIVGGPTYGHHTLTRFFALHVAILPPLIILFIVAHMVVFRRHGVTVPLVTQPMTEEGEPTEGNGNGWFWPDQAFRDMLVSMIIFGVLLALVIWGHGHPTGQPEDADWWERTAHAGREGRGANLDAPADPSQPYPARPEWYFLSLFQLLKYFKGDQQIIGTVVIPTAAGLLLFLLPLFGHRWMRKFGHVFGIIVVSALLGSAAVLTYLAIDEDRVNPNDLSERAKKAELFQAELAKASEAAKRAVQLARDGIPAEGPVYLLRRDPMTQGKQLFRQHCATCHNYQGEFESEKAIASDLAGFGTEQWIRALLRNPASPRFFGRTELKEMAKWVKENTDDPQGAKNQELDEIAKWLAGHPRGAPKEGDKTSDFAKGFDLFENRCMECHKYEGVGGTNPRAGPDFTGYGSPDWIRMMIMLPDYPYRTRSAMPIFRDREGSTAAVNEKELERTKALLSAQTKSEKIKKKIEELKLIHLSDIDRELIIRFVTGDHHTVFGGEPIANPDQAAKSKATDKR